MSRCTRRYRPVWRAAVAGLALALLTPAVIGSRAEEPPKGRTAMGPLRVHPDNPRYFADGSGKAILLVGSHTWPNLVDMGPTDPPPKFDFPAYLDRLQRHHHNFIRLWAWETLTLNTAQAGRKAVHHVRPHPWARTGPGKALDGKPKFNLAKFSDEYFRRLRSRVAAARKRGIYVSVMLFEGWALQCSPGAWEGHPFHAANNVNGVNGDVNGDGKGLEIHALAGKAVTAVQEAYVRKVIDTVNDLDNVLYEISNENHPPSTKWQVHMIDFLHKVEKRKPARHPVGMTFQYRGGSNKTLFDSPAEWVSPNPAGGYRDDPPAARGKKVVLNDTDHLWGIGGNRLWVWKSFFRGYNPIFMDPYDGVVLGRRFDRKWDPIHRAMGQALRLAERVNLARMTPKNRLSSTGYCLAKAPKKRAEYLVYLPKGGSVTVDLSAAPGKLAVEWFSPRSDTWHKGAAVRGGAPCRFTPPFQGDAILYLRSP